MTPAKRAWLVATVAMVAILGIGGTAHAVWTTSGAGAGASGTGSAASAVTLAAGTATDALRPGGTAEVRTTATNPNAAPVRLGALALDTTRGTSGILVAGASGTCPASAFSFTPSAAGWTVPANGSSAIVLPGAVGMAANAPTGCQGATVTVYLRAGA
ncbi:MULTISPECIES: hypothetical protein [unclassified Agrococcus]|uniref:hypothetical protein n=1 Tax=unclassified Agrococcus TaxID=2615065 RepID=UPI003610ABE2